MDREDLIQKAKVAEQAERYEDMADIMKEATEPLTQSDAICHWKEAQ
uniref:14-3-3 domain-containing protein n=1 Tax=Mola mola TaxID=94237 RepID=A0A3Q3X1F0_MOLML